MDTGSLLNQQIPIGLVLIFVQNWLKQQKWFPLTNYDTPKMNHLFSIVLTGLATLGIHFTWSSADHTLLITGLSLATVAHGAYSWLVQYIITKTGYTVLSSQLNPPTAQQPVAVVEAHVEAEKTSDPYKIK
jgi:protein-S-isoprenylcysteine O-methyltransferase Ste14